MCPFINYYRKDPVFDIQGKMISCKQGELCKLTKKECEHCTKVIILNKNTVTDITCHNFDGVKLYTVDGKGDVIRNGIQVI